MQGKFIFIFLFELFLAIGQTFLGPTAQATLGERQESVDNDQQKMQAKRNNSLNRDGYTIHEIESGSTTIRQYESNQSRIIFGVAWNGRRHPNLKNLLGSYHDEFYGASRNKARKLGSRSRSVRTNNIAVETWGHMGSLKGRAYIINLIPIGVTPNEIE